MHFKSLYPDVPPLSDLNVHDFCFRRPEQAQWPDYTVHIDALTGRRRKFSEFLQSIYDGSTALGAPVSEGGQGFNGKGDEIVAILSENCMDYITLVHSLLAITTPFAPCSAFSTPFELTHSLRLSKATHLFVQPKLFSLALGVCKEVGLPDQNIFILDGQVKGQKSFSQMMENVRRQNIPRVNVRPAKKDTLAFLVFSSGTGGLPKVVMISHFNVIFSTYQSMITTMENLKVFTPPPLDTPEGIPLGLAFLPLHHSYGLQVYSFRNFLAPTTSIFLPKWNLDQALKAIEKYRITHFLLIPSVIHQIVTSPKTKESDLSSLRFVASGAAHLSPQLAASLRSIAPKALMGEGYGQSEGTLSAIMRPFPGVLGGRQPIPGSTGILVPGVEARILRDDGSEADYNETGNLIIRGGNICLGYWNNDQANKETFVDGWLHTGDRFRADENGNFFFEDRVKDTLKVSGAQVSPVEIEDCLLAQPDKLIIDTTVAGVSGGRTSDERVPRAWIVLSAEGQKRGRKQVVKALEAWSQENLSKYKWLRGGIEIVEEIPKSPTGKVMRRILQEKHEAQLKKQARL